MTRTTSLLFLALVLAAGSASASLAPGDFGWVWPIEIAGDASIVEVVATPEVQEAFADPWRRDVAIFDARGQAVPMGPVEFADVLGREASWHPLPLFTLPPTPQGRAIDVRLHVESRPDRSLHRVDAEVGPGPGPGPTLDGILDATGAPGPIRGLRLSWLGDEAKKVSFAVEGSDDLEVWTVLVPSATVLKLTEGEKRLSHQTFPLPQTRHRYLRLRALQPVELTGLSVEALTVPDRPAPGRQWLEARLVSAGVEGRGGPPRGVYVYEAAFADVEAAEVVPSTGPTLAEVVLQSENAHLTWEDRARFALVQFPDGGGSGIEAVAAGLPVRRWRLEITPPLGAPPTLRLGHRPDRWVFLRQGEGPWTLAAGSARARGPVAPVERALEEARRKEGPFWQPSIATLGERVEVGGSAVATPPERGFLRAALLWGALSLGAGAVALLAFRLLRRAATAT